jgi:hypothetical protein
MKHAIAIYCIISTINLQAQSVGDCKYFQVISYIRTHEEFNRQIMPFLLNKKKTKFLDFNVSPWIQFMEYRQFKEKVNADSLGINRQVISNDRLFFEKYNFAPFKSSFLEKTISNVESKFYLTFSQVIGNSLMVEILNFDNNPHIVRRLGSGVKILFIFDQTGLIEYTLINKVAYN